MPNNTIMRDGHVYMLISGLNLTMLRRAAGLSQAELSKQIGCAQSTLCSIEKGRMPITTVSFGRAIKIADALGVSVNELVPQAPPGVSDDNN